MMEGLSYWSMSAAPELWHQACMCIRLSCPDNRLRLPASEMHIAQGLQLRSFSRRILVRTMQSQR